jgi:TetR/AcrR family transcriptional repressor of lmrAB and yxaGH operons
MAPAQKHRKPIVDAAVKLFRRKGYSGTGLNDIVDESGSPKGSLYHYFPDGKQSIAVAAIEEAGRRVLLTLADLSRRTPKSSQVVKAHARLLGDWMGKSNFRDGCPMTTVLLELAPQDRAIAEAGRKAYAARIDFLRNLLLAEGFSPARAQSLALLCTSALQGALIQARVERSAKPLLIAAEELASLIEAKSHAP